MPSLPIRCPKCGTSLGANARFCSICGTEAVASTQQFQSTQAMSAAGNRTQALGPQTQQFGSPTQQLAPLPGNPSDSKKIWIAAAGGAALVAVAGLIFLSAMGLLGAKKTTTGTGGVLTAPPTQTAQAPILTAPPAQPPMAPIISAPPAKNTPMPADVIDYLRWLKAFEADRLQLEAKGEAQMTIVLQELTKTMLTGPPGMNLLDGDPEGASQAGKNANKKAIDMTAVNLVIQDWNRATAVFQQKTPPNICASLAANYGGGLAGSVTQMTTLVQTTSSAIASINAADGSSTPDAQKALSGLMEEKNNRGGSQSVDGSFQQANAALDALRAQYTEIPADIDKPQFSIKSGGGGMNIPIPGLGM